MSKKLLLLTTEPENWAPQELVKASEAAGFDVEVVNPDECYINLSNEPYISYKGTKFMGADVCIPRMSEEHLDYKCAVINHLEEMDVKVLNNGPALKIASNKIETQIKLSAAGLKTPRTALFTGEEQLEYAMESIGGKFPMIVKTLYGTHGVGVMRADSEASLKSIVQQLIKMSTEFMLQEYFEHDESARILMLGDKCLAAVMRGTPKGDFRTNAHQGAELKSFKPSEKELEDVRKAAKTIGITFAAVDYIRQDDETIFFEVNGSPGFEAMQKVVDVNIAETVIKYCEELIGKKDEDEDKDFSLDDDEQAIQVDVSGDKNQVEIEVETDGTVSKVEGPAEEEEEEEETKEVDLDKKDKEVDVEAEEKKAEKKEKEVHPNQNVVDAEVFDKAQENIIGTVTSVKIAHFNDDAPIEARVDTGANTSSIAGEDIKIDGNSVKFKFNDVIYKFHLLRIVKIKQSDSDKVTERPVIRVDLTLNGIRLKNIEMNVTERAHMKYPILLGRSTLSQAAILVNPAAANIDPVSAYVTSKSAAEEE